MGVFDAALFAKETEASLVIPIHMDNPKFPVDITELKAGFDKAELNYKVLAVGESLEV